MCRRLRVCSLLVGLVSRLWICCLYWLIALLWCVFSLLEFLLVMLFLWVRGVVRLVFGICAVWFRLLCTWLVGLC